MKHRSYHGDITCQFWCNSHRLIFPRCRLDFDLRTWKSTFSVKRHLGSSSTFSKENRREFHYSHLECRCHINFENHSNICSFTKIIWSLSCSCHMFGMNLCRQFIRIFNEYSLCTPFAAPNHWRYRSYKAACVFLHSCRHVLVAAHAERVGASSHRKSTGGKSVSDQRSHLSLLWQKLRVAGRIFLPQPAMDRGCGGRQQDALLDERDGRLGKSQGGRPWRGANERSPDFVIKARATTSVDSNTRDRIPYSTCHAWW